ncbi:MAG: ThiF family adenylyltransferase [bacterium]|nr:ThiF family adenylyltransferase [bacterium]
MHKPKFYRTKGALPKGTKTIDTLRSALGELFFIDHPQISKSDPKAARLLKTFLATAHEEGRWMYYPWLHTAVRVPSEEVYFRLRTARNRDLITEEEQLVYRDTVVGVAGLSVGSAVVASLVATGGPKRMKIADPDFVEITNLNRMCATLADIGSNKAEVVARNVWELDPFAEIEVWNTGLHLSKLKDFLLKKPALNIFIDEMDDIAMKVAVRFACRSARIPVVMATDNGDSVIVDIERFDLEPRRPIFHGRVHLQQAALKDMSRGQFIALSTKIIDPTFFTMRQQQSILGIGKRLSGVAQLGTAAGIAGAAIAYVTRAIANGTKMPSGRYSMGCEPIFIQGYNGARAKQVRRRNTVAFMKALSAPRKVS